RGKPSGVDLAALVEQRHDRELVEDDHHNRGGGSDGRGGLRLLAAGEDEVGYGRVEEEEGGEEGRRGRERRQEGAADSNARVDACGGNPDERGGEDQERGRPAEPLQGLERNERRQPRDEEKVDGRARPPACDAGKRLDEEERGRRADGEGEREEDDVPARRIVRDEELGVSAEQVEEGLRERERGQPR